MNILVLADLHLGHKKIPGWHIYSNLKTYVYPKLKNIHLLILAGDTFHSLLDFNNEAAQYVIQLFNDLFYLSKKYNFGIRILRGTFYHDRNQINYIKQSAHKFLGDTPIDIKTYSEVSVDEEIFNKESIKILYLPDDLSYKSQDECLDTVKQLLDSRKWDKVDLIIGHGYMSHVLPFGVKGPSVTYTLDQLSLYCSHLAVFGHVHTPSTKSNDYITAVYVGSFERMNHGEEEAKGFLLIDTTHWSTTFYENKNTIKFITYTPNTDSNNPEEIIEQFKEWCKNQHFPKEQFTYIRVKYAEASIRSLLGRILKSEYPSYPLIYTAESIKKTNVVLENPLEKETIDLIIPTEDNVIDLIHSYMKDHLPKTISKDRIKQIWSLDFEDNHGTNESIPSNDGS